MKIFFKRTFVEQAYTSKMKMSDTEAHELKDVVGGFHTNGRILTSWPQDHEKF